jgi:coenzyme PQQ synthesis protein D (PqqD)
LAQSSYSPWPVDFLVSDAALAAAHTRKHTVATAAPDTILDQYSLSDRFRPFPHVVWTRHTDATVLLDAERGLYYTLNEVASRVWELLAAGEPVIEILRVMRDEYEVEGGVLEPDVTALLTKLQTARLIERMGS